MAHGQKPNGPDEACSASGGVARSTSGGVRSSSADQVPYGPVTGPGGVGLDLINGLWEYEDDHGEWYEKCEKCEV